MVKNQIDQTQNGIYVIKAEAWVRAEDFDASTEVINSTVAVTEGTVNIYSKWTCKAGRIILGKSNIAFLKVADIDPSDPFAQ